MTLPELLELDRIVIDFAQKAWVIGLTPPGSSDYERRRKEYNDASKAYSAAFASFRRQFE